MIDKSGEWWKGEDFNDLRHFVVEFTSQNYRADDIRQSVCSSCGGTRFNLWLDDDEGCARRDCTNCAHAAFIGDSEEWWGDADPGEAECPCGEMDFQVAVGFSLI